MAVNFFCHFSSYPFFVLYHQNSDPISRPSKMLFSFTRSEVSGHVNKHSMELDNKEKCSPTLPFSYLMFTLWTFLTIFLFTEKF